MASLNKIEKPTVLIVDDSRTVRFSLSIILRDQFSLIEGVDGEDGWTKLLENPHINLVITDIMMPNLDGYGFICRIRGADAVALNNIPIVVITSKEDEITRERAHACGANNFIVKPAESSDLLETVKFHTEVDLTPDQKHAPKMEKYEKYIENTIMETPDLDKALDIIEHSGKDSLEPYAIELAMKVFPLLEYCNKTFQMDVAPELDSLKSKLKSA